jgi:hypothetical protein
VARSLRLTVLGFEECGLAGVRFTSLGPAGRAALAANAHRAPASHALTVALMPWACGTPG